jgi:hypothetical protein
MVRLKVLHVLSSYSVVQGVDTANTKEHLAGIVFSHLDCLYFFLVTNLKFALNFVREGHGQVLVAVGVVQTFVIAKFSEIRSASFDRDRYELALVFLSNY